MEERPPHQRITGWVICGKAELTERTATGELPHDADSGRASAACPAATRLVGGGVRVPLPGKSSNIDIRPTTFGPVDGADSDLVPDDRWRMEADYWGGLPRSDLPVESTAICLN